MPLVAIGYLLDPHVNTDKTYGLVDFLEPGRYRGRGFNAICLIGQLSLSNLFGRRGRSWRPREVMSPVFANVVALAAALGLVWLLALGLLWRIGSWQVSPAATLNLDEGLRVGSAAPEIAGLSTGEDRHLSFHSTRTFLVFGSAKCAPCLRLLEIAPSHPATRPMRLVYLTTGNDTDLPPDILASWETYQFHDSRATREMWRAPVSPFFHVIGENGKILDKGIASTPSHLDRLLGLTPPQLAAGYGLISQPNREGSVT